MIWKDEVWLSYGSVHELEVRVLRHPKGSSSVPIKPVSADSTGVFELASRDCWLGYP